MNNQLKKDLQDTLYIHAPLPLHPELSLEQSIEDKEVLDRKVLWENGGPLEFIHRGLGEISIADGGKKEGNKSLRITAPYVWHSWPEGSTPDGDYTNYGHAQAIMQVNGQNWEKYNRVSFWIKPECDGMRAIHLNMGIVNTGKIKVPDEYQREGSNMFDLRNHEWNYCIWEFTEMGRDEIQELIFGIGVNGRDTSSGDVQHVDIDCIELQRVEGAEVERGWQPGKDRIAFSTTGYFANGKKTAIANVDADTFSIVKEGTDEVVLTKAVEIVENFGQSFKVLDFTEVTESGRYQIKIGNVLTYGFEIGDKILESSVWKAINFLFCERCGHPVPRKHGVCHSDIVAEHNGVTMSYNGGWHDAGDLSQQTAQSAEVTHALLEVAQIVKDDKALYLRLLEEAEWGMEFVLKTRFGDGYRATSAPATRWTDGKTGNMDDIPARVHCHSFENILMAGIQAYASIAFKERDVDLAFKCLKTAKEDFDFGLDRFLTVGIELPIMFEHTYNSGPSQYYATISWAASNIFMACGDKKYADIAAEYGNKVVACQETGEKGLQFKGYFYRDETHKAIVHFNHQSREQAFIQALELLCKTQPDHPDKAAWENAMKLNGEYIKALMKYVAPYGMAPAGIHSMDEVDDKETFDLLHLAVDFNVERQNYIEQLENAIKIDDKHCLKMFPVWFSFRGNAAIHLATGKSAAIIGKYFKDKELIEIAREQAYWILGKNPFTQSLMYGEGTNYVRQYAGHTGEMVGELPVGVETYGNDDEPYWPQTNNATYKEVWTSTAGRWLWLASELFEGGEEQ